MPNRSLASFLLVAACAVQLSLAQPPAHAASLALSLCGSSYPSPTGGFPRVLHVGTRPQGAEVSERTGHAFIPLSGTNGIGGAVSCRSSVTTVDASTGRFIRTVPVGAISPAIVVDDTNGRVFVASYAKSGGTSVTLTGLDLRGRVVRTLPPLGVCPCAGGGMGPLIVGVDASHGRFFVFTYQSVIVLDARALQLVRMVAIDSGSAGGGPNYAIDAQHGRLFIATVHGITVLSSTTGAALQRIDLGASERSIVLDAQTGRLFVGSSGGACRGGGAPGNVTVLDSATGKIVRTVLSSCFGFPSVLVDVPARRVLIQVHLTTPNIRYAILDANTGRVVQSVDMPSALNYSAVDARSGRIYNGAMICTDGSGGCTRMVQVLDPKSWRVVKTLRIPSGWQGALTVAARARRLLVVGPYNGTLTVAPTV